MKLQARALLLLFPLMFTSCGNPALRVSVSRSPATACLGAAIGATTGGSVTYVGSPASVGDVRFRWLLSADAVPSTDDLTMLGSGAEVTVGSMNGGDVYSIVSPDLIVPGGARLGPQYLILAAVDLGATSAGISFAAVPITINQCPSAGACDASFPTEASYTASTGLSGGPHPLGRERDRPVFLSDGSTLPARGLTVGGHDGAHGLLLRYDEARSFRWGRSLSHCTRDEVESMATFNDGTLAVITAYYTGTRQEIALSAYSAAGSLLWQRVLTGSANSCRTCLLT